MKFNLPKLTRILRVHKKKKSYRKSSKTKLKKRKKKAVVFDKRKFTPKEKEGYELGKTASSLWKLQSNPQKVYVGGNRIHHGLFGAALTLYGAIEHDDYVKGLGESLMEDDVNDMPRWLDFERLNSDFTGFA